MTSVDAKALAQALSSSPLPVVAAFTRKGAAPSDELVQSLADVEKSLGKAFTFVSIDMDAATSKPLVEELRVHKVPELLVWAKGGKKLVARMEGAMRPEELRGFLEHAAKRG